MSHINFLDYKKNVFSQNGEDGIIEKLFTIIGTQSKTFCEFGAWDGIHFSNTRNLALDGWSGIYIEAEPSRYQELVNNYKTNKLIVCLNTFVDCKKNNLDKILEKVGKASLDFLSIDIDGLDYKIFENLKSKPRVLCIEVNAGHSPQTKQKLPETLARENIGQPLAYFSKIAKQKGYQLLCYTGNAFYIRNDLVKKYKLSVLSDDIAYWDFLNSISQELKNWMFLVNLGIVSPYYQYRNPFLSRKNLSISVIKALKITAYRMFKHRKEIDWPKSLTALFTYF